MMTQTIYVGCCESVCDPGWSGLPQQLGVAGLWLLISPWASAGWALVGNPPATLLTQLRRRCGSCSPASCHQQQQGQGDQSRVMQVISFCWHQLTLTLEWAVCWDTGALLHQDLAYTASNQGAAGLSQIFRNWLLQCIPWEAGTAPKMSRTLPSFPCNFKPFHEK